MRRSKASQVLDVSVGRFSLLAEALSWFSLTGEKRPLPWVENGSDLTAVHSLRRLYLKRIFLALFADCNLRCVASRSFLYNNSAVIY